MLPPYVYRMIDHMYLSDARGYVARDHFDVVIHTDGITRSGPLLKNQTPKTLFISSSKGVLDQTQTILTEMKPQTKPRLILLYGDDMNSACNLFVTYLKQTYHFTQVDIMRIVTTGNYPKNVIDCLTQ